MVTLVHYLVCECVIAQVFYILISETASIIKERTADFRLKSV